MSSKALRVLCIGTLLWMATPGLPQSPWLVPYGTGSCGSDFVPTFHTAGEMPVIGNPGFQVVSENLNGGTLGFILLSSAQANLSFLGMTLYADPLLGIWLARQATGTGGPGVGAVRLPLPIPNNAALMGGKLFIQGFFFDASVAPSSLVHTHGLGVTIAQSISPDVAVIRDRLKYQAHFAGVTSSAQADPRGRAIWAANQVPGFTYVKTVQFTCGGESHWMVIVLHAQTGMEFCLIPGGSFRMGDVKGTFPWSTPNNELPVHDVRIKPFLLARTEVTQAQFTALMGTSPWQGKQNVMIGPDFAASFIDWNDSAAFCARANLRLPTEAEWEYACRAGVETCYHFGENFNSVSPSARLGLHAWYVANTWNANPPEKYAHQVGRLLPNAFGLHDMNGNQWEWAEDNWPSTYNSQNYKCAPTDGRAWLGGSSSQILRGGGWDGSDKFCRSSFRIGYSPASRIFDIGFRPSSSMP